jgi:hypothetical protein
MTSVDMQLHCLPQELVEWMIEASDKVDVALVLVSGRPFSARRVAAKNLLEDVADASRTKSSVSIFIVPTQSRLVGTTRTEFYELNPDLIIVDIGMSTSEGLRQAAISTTIDCPPLEKVAKRIRKIVRERTAAGVTAVNVDTGHRKLWKNFRYSDKAAELERNGVAMLAFAGGVKLLLGDHTN